ncbi:MAG: endonuclease/exonuclease/phosphatase family protein [Turicibacter sp.]
MEEAVKIVTFNIRIPVDTGLSSWSLRKKHVLDKIKNESPVLIGFQEIIDETLIELKDSLTDYVFIGGGRLNDLTGEGPRIAYHKDKLDLMSYDVFWLSQTPDLPGSKYPEGSILPRTCGVAIFRMRATQQLIRIYNTHLDHECSEARVKQVSQLLADLEKRQERMPLPTLIMGDLNATPESKEIRLFHEESNVSLVDLTETIENSFHDFGRTAIKIDYVFASESVECLDVKAWDDCIEGVYLSDHYPIAVSVEFKN